MDIQSETDRYIVWPGQALAYKVGQLKILELRERARSGLATASPWPSSMTRCWAAARCHWTCWKIASMSGSR